MMKVTCVLMVSLLLTFSAFAGPEDEGYGYVDPILGPWQTDQVVWSAVGNAIIPFGRAANGIIGNYWYNFGEQNSNVGQALNLTTDTWEMSTPPLLGNCNWCGVVADGSLYIVGRYDGAYGPEFQKFTPTGAGPFGTWEFKAPYPHSVCGVAGAWDGGNYIYACGGGTPNLTNAYRYDIPADIWIAIADLPEAMKYHGAFFVEGKFHAVGGYQTATAHYAYDPGANTWSAAAAVPTEIYFSTFQTTQYTYGGVEYGVVIGGGGGYSSWPATDAVQVYNPTIDTWSYETALPVAWGLTSGCIDPTTNIGYSAGGYTPWQTSTYKGETFGGAATPPDVTVFLDPIGSTIIEPTGGTLEFIVGVTNNEAGQVSFEAWTDVTLPTGAIFGPLIGPLNLTLMGGQTVDRTRTQDVPATAPPGLYTYNAYAAESEAFFEFEKLASGDGGVYIGDWSTSGELFEGELPEKFALMGNYPNPFNPTTTIEFSLNHAGFVELSVFDVTGRHINTLVDGFRDAGVHEVTFDAAGMATGLYVYRLTSGAQTAAGKMILMK